jgi:putative acetyltransferase
MASRDRRLLLGAERCASKSRSMSPILIERVHAVTDDVRALIYELDAGLAVAYPPEQLHGLTLNSLFEPHVQFFIARQDAAAVGCGGIAFFDGFAEVKRMYVREAARGDGVAQAMLAHLEDVARNGGVTLLRLETGVRQPAAIRLYERVGFRPCAAFAPYTTMAPAAIKNSLFYEKQLGAPSA